MRDTLNVCFPKRARNATKRLARIAKKRDRSVNYLVVEAIMRYLEREEKK